MDGCGRSPPTVIGYLPAWRAGNPAFDVTPARLVTGFITERGVCGASEADVLSLFPEKRG